MGRHAGWLTAASVLARKFEGDNPVLIYLPEVAFDQEQFLADVQKAFEHTSNPLSAFPKESMMETVSLSASLQVM